MRSLRHLFGACAMAACGGSTPLDSPDAGKGGASLEAGDAPVAQPDEGSEGAGDGPGADASAVALGEYWIDVPDLGSDSPIHVRVTSPTTAQVFTHHYLNRTFSIERFPGVAPTAQIIPDAMGGPYGADPPWVLRGAFVLRDTTVGMLFPGMRSIAVSEGLAGHFGSDAIVVYRTTQCIQGDFWAKSPGTARADVDPTTASVTSFDVGSAAAPFMPWSAFSFVLSKPIDDPLSRDVRAIVDGASADVTWDSSDRGHFMLWPSLLGKTVDFVGSIRSTNGVASPVAPSTSLQFMKFDPVMSRTITLTAPPPSNVEFWGADFVAAGIDSTCPSGCFRMSSEGGLAVRFASNVTGVTVRYRTRLLAPAPPVAPIVPMNATTMTLDGTPVVTVLPDAGAAFVDAAIPVPTSADGFFLVLSSPMARTNVESGPSCEMPARWTVYMESISVTP